MASTDEGHVKDDLLVAALARSATQARAAQESDYSERTVRRRLEDEKFRARVRVAQQESLQRATGAMVTGAPAVVNTLLKLMASAKSDSVRLGAAKALIELLPLRKMLGEVAELPEAPIIEIIMPDWRKESQKRLDRGDMLSAKGDAQKPGGGSKRKSRGGSKKKPGGGSKKKSDDGSKQADKTST